MRKFFIVLVLFFSAAATLSAQSGKTITGIVRSSENNQPLENVTILEKGGSKAAMTAANGSYSITLDQDNATLVFSFVGYGEREEVVGNRTTINVVLSASEKGLNEVVVTALGIRRES